MSLKIEIDSVDKGIINILQENAKTPYTEIGKKLFVSAGTVHARIKKLEKLKVIKKTTIDVDYSLLAYDITCFVGIYLKMNNYYDSVKKDLEKINEVLSVHYTTGQYSMLIKMIFKDTKHLRVILHDSIQKIEGIQRTETLISLEESIDSYMKL